MVRGAIRERGHGPGARSSGDPWVALALALPWISIVIASLAPFPVMATALPLIPPTGFLMLMAWRLVRPGLLPAWAGFPLGAVDDLFSGQPFGCGIVLFSIAMITLEWLDRRVPWRTFLQDWLIAALASAGYVVIAYLVSGADLSAPGLLTLLPQAILAAALFPAAARLVAILDRWRLARWRRTAG